ncbi:hypothetical protein DFP72DRAFT_1069168 [Ephemerocybe angulata]|uniref:Uncharacterized protein n=1 Tax=Ephemerocybe angulata TaxID=980116 RepID=A0A8H6HWH5_9AGAR|nr:hypothetical protein DFP72DRAFT_1069168 [Tulosesus angulatus]
MSAVPSNLPIPERLHLARIIPTAPREVIEACGAMFAQLIGLSDDSKEKARLTACILSSIARSNGGELSRTAAEVAAETVRWIYEKDEFLRKLGEVCRRFFEYIGVVDLEDVVRAMKSASSADVENRRTDVVRAAQYAADLYACGVLRLGGHVWDQCFAALMDAFATVHNLVILETFFVRAMSYKGTTPERDFWLDLIASTTARYRMMSMSLEMPLDMAPLTMRNSSAIYLFSLLSHCWDDEGRYRGHPQWSHVVEGDLVFLCGEMVKRADALLLERSVAPQDRSEYLDVAQAAIEHAGMTLLQVARA